jgi:hypothetical protein
MEWWVIISEVEDWWVIIVLCLLVLHWIKILILKCRSANCFVSFLFHEVWISSPQGRNTSTLLGSRTEHISYWLKSECDEEKEESKGVSNWVVCLLAWRQPQTHNSNNRNPPRHFTHWVCLRMSQFLVRFPPFFLDDVAFVADLALANPIFLQILQK